jgi:hypothetical protein
MTAQPELERTMARWLAAEASPAGRERVLATALARVATSDQERFLTQRLLGDRVGRAPMVRRVLAVALVVGLLAGAAAIIGALVHEPPPVLPTSRTNGAISYAAGGDVYLVEPGVAPRRIVGLDGDVLDRGCQSFSADGTQLAYVEADTPWDTAATWSIVVAAVDAHGAPRDASFRVTNAGNLTDCPVWSADLARFAYVRPVGGDLMVGRLAEGSQPVELVRGPGNAPTAPTDDFMLRTLAWSPGGERLAYVRSSGQDLQTSEIWVADVAAATAPISVVPAEAGSIVNAVAWSPDGRRLAYDTFNAAGDAVSARIVRAALSLSLPTTIAGASAPAWSPDGRSIAFNFAGRLVIQELDSGERSTLPEIRLDRRVWPGAASWSPDGEWLLLEASDADFVDRGVSYTVLAVDPDGIEPPVVLAPWQLGFHRDLVWQGFPR